MNTPLQNPAPRPEPVTIDVVEVAALVGCHPVTVRRLAAMGQFPAPLAVGSRRRWCRADVLSWIHAGGQVVRNGRAVEVRG